MPRTHPCPHIYPKRCFLCTFCKRIGPRVTICWVSSDFLSEHSPTVIITHVTAHSILFLNLQSKPQPIKINLFYTFVAFLFLILIILTTLIVLNNICCTKTHRLLLLSLTLKIKKAVFATLHLKLLYITNLFFKYNFGWVIYYYYLLILLMSVSYYLLVLVGWVIYYCL